MTQQISKEMNHIAFAKNARINNVWQRIELNVPEEEAVRNLHKDYTNMIMSICIEDAKRFAKNPADKRAYAVALFTARADKIYTWIQNALDIKRDITRNGFRVEEEQVSSSSQD